MQGCCQLTELPATDHAETREFRLHTQTVALGVGGEVVVGQFVGQNGQVNGWIALHLPCNIERVFVQLATTRGKGRDQTDSHRVPSEQCDAHIRSKMLTTASCKIEELLLLHAGRETDWITQLNRVAFVLKYSSERHGVGNGKSALNGVICMKTHVSRVCYGGIHAPIAGGGELDAPNGAQCLRDGEAVAIHTPRPQVFGYRPHVQTL